MGYEVERFVDKVPNSFLCLICHEVVKNPKECTSCESLFCGDCIAACIELNGYICPNRCEKSEMQRPGRIIRTNLEDLLLRCKYAKNGCGKVDRVGRIEIHEQDECPYNCDIKKCASPICNTKEAVENMILFATPEKPSTPDIYVCSLKCAATLEFQNILNTSRSQEEMLRRLQSRFMENINNIVALSSPITSIHEQDNEKPIIYSSTTKVKKDAVELPDGSVYTGEWTLDGRIEGKGVQTWQDGARYSGEFLNGEKHGYGNKTTSNGQSYYGFWKHNNRSGHGTYRWPSGSTYTGNFKHGDNHGWGKYTWHNGKIYEGEYKNDEKDGFGAMIFPDGRRYVGEWKHNMHHGKGVLTNSDGSEYQGEFVDDMKQGYGVMRFPDNSKQIGYWESDKLHGVVTFISKDDQKEVQLWRNGQRINLG
ncbi:unnamed protein product [Blepharisma stoltei]|uniref:MORN repeat protein n=1 Tax=Blepharisma stoltei TaxID=1481888 RepID=A0AAU9KCJ2_9CILI|nr:unnamed protein product [Blepharisma stoltei]